MKPFCLVSLAFAAAMAAEPFRLPVPMVWQVNYDTLSRRQYIKDIDYLRAHTRADILQLAPVEGVMPEDADQFHAPVKELVEYARSRGFREILRTSPKTRGSLRFAKFRPWVSKGSPWMSIFSSKVVSKSITLEMNESTVAKRQEI